MQLLLHAESSPWRTFKRQMLKPLLLPGWLLLTRYKSVGAWRDFSAINPRMAAHLDLDSRMREAGHDPTYRYFAIEDARPMFFGPAHNIATSISSEMSAGHGVSCVDPTANLSLTEFLLRVPDSQFRRNGRGCSLLRRSLRDRLPEQVMDRRLHGVQSADIGHRVLDELPAIQRALDSISSQPAANEFLDVPYMKRTVEDLMAKVDPDTTDRAVTVLLRGLDVGLFLLRMA
jgi:asparagine synthase (glutamine-hydrolysing)